MHALFWCNKLLWVSASSSQNKIINLLLFFYSDVQINVLARNLFIFTCGTDFWGNNYDNHQRQAVLSPKRAFLLASLTFGTYCRILKVLWQSPFTLRLLAGQRGAFNIFVDVVVLLLLMQTLLKVWCFYNKEVRSTSEKVKCSCKETLYN